MSTNRAIPFAKLRPHPANVRNGGAEASAEAAPDSPIASLAASIEAHGLINPLTVVTDPDVDDGFLVVAGTRRLAALSRLVANPESEWTLNTKVAAVLVGADRPLVELSLAENEIRLPLHPVEQIQAFRTLDADGATVPEIAARFGYAEATVQKRLRLAGVADEVLDGYRGGDMSLEAVEGFASTEDRSRQVEIYRKLKKEIDDPRSYRRTINRVDVTHQLDESRVSLRNPLAKFVGREAYVAAGGAVDTDLFDDEVYLVDRDLLVALATEKLEKRAAPLRKRWKWVEIALEFTWDDERNFKRCGKERAEPTEDELEEIARYQKDVGSDDQAVAASARKAIRAIHAKVGKRDDYNEHVKAHAGAVVTIDYNGKGSTLILYRKADAPKTPTEQREDKAKGGLSEAARQELRELRLAHARPSMEFAPALDLMTYTLLRRVFGEIYLRAGAAVDVRSYQVNPRDEVTAQVDELGILDKDPAKAWSAFVKVPQAKRRALFAAAVAELMPEQLATDGNQAPEIEATLARLSIDWTAARPTADNYFRKLPKHKLIELAAPFVSDERVRELGALKKGELAAELEDLFKAESGDVRIRKWTFPGFAPKTPKAQKEK